MRISELSARSGVSVATIKYYLRERVLPEGERTSPTQATYGEPHLRRLGVIRALVDAGVGIAGVRNVISVLENPPESPGALLGAASTAVNPDTDDAHLDLEPACALVARFGLAEPADMLRAPLLQQSTRPRAWANWLEEQGLPPQRHRGGGAPGHARGLRRGSRPLCRPRHRAGRTAHPRPPAHRGADGRFAPVRERLSRPVSRGDSWRRRRARACPSGRCAFRRNRRGRR